MYEKKDAKEASVKGEEVEPTLDSLAVSCKEALAEYLTLSRGLDSVFVLDREDFLHTKLNPAKKLFNERNKEFQRALLNDREIGMSLFSEPRSVQSYEEVARELCAKSVSPLNRIVLTLSVLDWSLVELFCGLNTVDASALMDYWYVVSFFAFFLFCWGCLGSMYVCIIQYRLKASIYGRY